MIIATLLLIVMLMSQMKTAKMTTVIVSQIVNVVQMMTHRTKMLQKLMKVNQKKVKQRKAKQRKAKKKK